MNRYAELANNNKLFVVMNKNNKYCLCTINDKGKNITLKNNLNYWDVTGYAYNRANKKKIKKHKYKNCSCCGISSKNVKYRINPLTLELNGQYKSIALCLKCYNIMSADI